MDFLRRGRLAADARLIAVVAERRRRNLPAGVAVDAGVIDIEVALDVLRQSMLELRHTDRWIRIVTPSSLLVPLFWSSPGTRRARRGGPARPCDSSTSTEILISLVEIISMLMPSLRERLEHLRGDAGVGPHADADDATACRCCSSIVTSSKADVRLQAVDGLRAPWRRRACPR